MKICLRRQKNHALIQDVQNWSGISVFVLSTKDKENNNGQRLIEIMTGTEGTKKQKRFIKAEPGRQQEGEH